MRIGFFLLILCAAAAIAADADVANTLVTSKRTPTADAPAFGSGSYFRKVFNAEAPRVELKPPVRLSEFAVDGKLELSLRNFIDLVLSNNTDIQVQRLSVETSRNDILRQYTIFDPRLIASFSTTRQQRPVVDVITGSTTLTQPFRISGTQMLQTGTTYTVGWDTSKVATNSPVQRLNPSITSNLNFQIAQPLLRNRGMFVTKLPVTIAQSRLKVSQFQIVDQILRLVNSAENAYWDVVLAREQLKVQEQNLALNDQFLKRARRELELGAISQLDIYQPEAQYKNAELAVTQARFRLQSVEDVLRRQISADIDPAVRELPLVLTEDVGPPTQLALDRADIVSRALRQRPDILSIRQSLDVDDLRIRSATNMLKPDLRLTANYTSGGVGGNCFATGQGGLCPGSVAFLPGGLSDSLSQVFNFNNPTYGMGLQLTLPLRDRQASADYADAVVNKRLDMLRVRTQEQTARLEVLNAITEVERSKASVELARVALELAQKRLDAEQKKFDLGTTTLYFVLDANTASNTAQSNLVNQTVNYRRSLSTLSRTTADLLSERGIAIQ